MKVLLVDDHPLILSALRSVIRGLGDDVVVVGMASAAAARERLAQDAGFDLVLLDLTLGDADGFDVLIEMRRNHPALPVVVLSASERPADVIRAIDLGAMGFVPKRIPTIQLKQALQLVLSGGLYVPKMMLGRPQPPAAPQEEDTVPSVMQTRGEPLVPGPPPEALQPSSRDALPPALVPGPASAAAGPDTGSAEAPEASEAEAGEATLEDLLTPALLARLQQPEPALDAIGLTPRQSEVLALLLRGMPNKMIARELGLSVETIKDHVAALLRALGVSTRTQAVLAVSRLTQDAQRRSEGH